ncbi:hypothetical protein [Staphylococcus pasteuri]|uniref:hypothetical protein n=1 Tax=Staphylococcus pasteuri TaxID=45972 RepID=UPI001E500144|nr:hypothetical protein [Staphylococcus pasteuri]MCE3023120.1 hypothetical protein [Staphylococcus pasteuri]
MEKIYETLKDNGNKTLDIMYKRIEEIDVLIEKLNDSKRMYQSDIYDEYIFKVDHLIYDLETKRDDMVMKVSELKEILEVVK